MQTVHLFLTHYAQERNSSENENILTFTARKSNSGVSKVSYIRNRPLNVVLKGNCAMSKQGKSTGCHLLPYNGVEYSVRW